jgi:DNA-binding GntR family transcriptional regulator
MDFIKCVTNRAAPDGSGGHPGSGIRRSFNIMAGEKAKGVAKNTLRQQAYVEIKRALIAGQFEPGAPLTVRSLSESLGLGAMPVREGVQQLAAEGGLELLPNRTVRVASPSAKDLDEIFEARIVLESFAASKAADEATSDEMKAIRSNLQKVLHSVKAGKPHDGLRSNMDFHFSVYRACHSACMIDIIERLWLKMGPMLVLPYRSRKLDGNSFFAKSTPLHFALIESVEQRQAKEAGRSMTKIIRLSWDWYRTIAEILGR